MEDNKSYIATVVLLFIPVIIAISQLITNFNILDLIYLLLVILICLRYFIKVKVLKNM